MESVDQGGIDMLREGVAALAAEVEKNEPGCLSYQYFFNEKENEIAVFEIYKDAAAAEAHKDSAHFAEARKAMDGKLSTAPSIQVVVRKGGFRRG